MPFKTGSLRYMSKEMFRTLSLACIKGLIEGEQTIQVSIPKYLRYYRKDNPAYKKSKTHDPFPIVGNEISENEEARLYQLNCRSLLNWLYRNGYSTISTNRLLASVNNLEQDIVDMDKVEDEIPASSSGE